jgi:hypothetical protein
MNDQDKTIKEIPYGITNYTLIRKGNYYYVDKTPFLETIRKAGRYLFFIRPRRFGKSLLLSVMQSYYDVSLKDRFDEFFKGTWIYDHPDEERNKYLVLSLNFSMVDPDFEKVEASFLNYVRGRAVRFIQRYREYLSENREMDYYSRSIEKSGSASDIFSSLLMLCKGAKQKLYVLIDEYDNFANILLSTAGTEVYHDLEHASVFFRSFFNVLKGGTTGTDAPVARSFITGVSPVTMDDVTSGYNIGENVSLAPAFNQALGFTREDVDEMLRYYGSVGLLKHDLSYLGKIITQWYGNYLFCEDENIRLFNSDMVLYFFKQYFKIQSLPENLIDRNVRIDYGKLKHLIIIDRGKTGKPSTNGNFDRLKEIVAKGEIPAKLVDAFPLEEVADTDNFISLLFYFGLLTIKEAQLTETVLAIPNEAIRRLYYDYIKGVYEETGVFSIDLHNYSRLINRLAMHGEWRPFFQYITGRMRESMGLRDLIAGEKSIQAFLNVYLGLSDLYIIHSERELNKGFADIVMEPFLARYEGINYSCILEIKYLEASAKPGEGKVQQLKAAAVEQLKKYGADEKFAKTIGKTRLIKLALIFSGHELVDIAEAEPGD